MNAKLQGILKRRGIKLRINNIGFTIFELLVSISIIALLSGLILVNYHSANKRLELVNAAQKMVSDIRLTQNYALGLKEFNGVPPSGGWGLYFNLSSSGSYVIFADSNNDKDYTSGEEFKIFNSPAGIEMSSVYVGQTAVADSAVITFIPPDPTIYITDAELFIKITLKENQGNTTKTIEVNSLGLVDVID